MSRQRQLDPEFEQAVLEELRDGETVTVFNGAWASEDASRAERLEIALATITAERDALAAKLAVIRAELRTLYGVATGELPVEKLRKRKGKK